VSPDHRIANAAPRRYGRWRYGPWRLVAAGAGVVALALPAPAWAAGPAPARALASAGWPGAASVAVAALVIAGAAAAVLSWVAARRARAALGRAEREHAAHLRFLEAMVRVDRAIAGATELEAMTNDVLDVALSVFSCDRAFLVHPCDPGAAAWSVPFERTRPEHPGLRASGVEVPMNGKDAEILRVLLAANRAVQFGHPGKPPMPAGAEARFGVKAFMAIAIRPKVGSAWEFGIHQCSHARTWTADEERLLEEIGRRLVDALAMLTVFRELRESERELREAERIGHLGSWTFDARSGALTCSEELGRMYGLAPGQRQVPPGGEAAVYTPESLERLAPVLEHTLRTGEPYEVDLELRDPALATRWVTTHAEAVRDAQGAVVGLRGTSLDITARRRAEEALRRSEAQYRRLVETAHEGIWAIDPEGRTTFVNGQVSRMTGYTAEELLGRSATEFVAEASHALLREKLARRREGISEQYELEFRRKDGAPLWAILEAAPVIEPDGRHVGSFAMLTDVTERRALEAQLRQAHKLEAVGRLAGGVAHDFNNLLTAILGNAQVLADELGVGHPLRTEAEEIQAAAQKAVTVTRRLLTFGRKVGSPPRIVDLGELVSSIEVTLRRIVGDRVELVMDVAPALGSVRADPTQLEDVILSLVVNARDAMGDGGRIVLTLAEAGAADVDPRLGLDPRRERYLRLTVHDTGTGMTPEVQAHLFEPFFSTKGPGKGLGLAAVYGVVKQAGGDVRVRSAPGRGTSVEVYLPRTDAPVERPRPHAPAEPAPGARTILVVEDEPMVRALAARLLRRAGYVVIDAADADDALRLVPPSGLAGVDLLLTDVVMPRVRGPELADRLRALRPDLPVLFASGYTEHAEELRSRLGERTDFIPKPFTPGELTRKVRALLDRASGRRAAGAPRTGDPARDGDGERP
jgi:PAS domain S-box-containing protein